MGQVNFICSFCGYVLTTSHSQVQLDLTYLSDVQPGEPTSVGTEGGEEQENIENGKDESVTAFDRPILDDGHRPVIVYLVSRHFRNKESEGS